MIRLATKEDFNEVKQIIEDGKEYHLKNNINQWFESYPDDKLISEDLNSNQCFVYEENNIIQGVMSLTIGKDENYNNVDGSFLVNNDNYCSIHRLGVKKEYYGKGVAKQLFDYAYLFAFNHHVDALRIDTSDENKVMTNLIVKKGYQRIGKFSLDDGYNGVAYELKLKKGLIITNAFSLSDSMKHSLERYLEEFKKLNVIIDHKTNKELLVYLDYDKLKTNLKYYDFIVYLDKDRHISKMLEKCGFKLFNKGDAIEVCDDKMLTHIALANNGILMPKTISSPLYYAGEDDGKFLTNVINELSFPIIVKEVYGSFGKQVYKIDNFDRLKKIREKLQHIPHIYQEYIETSKGRDIRVILVNKKVVACMERVSKNDFRSNIELGAKGYPLELNTKIKEMAEKIATILDLDYCGLDLLYGKENQYILCEVNSNAMFNEIEKVSKINVCKIYCEYIYKTIYGG